MDQDQRAKVLFILPALVAGGAERVLIELMNGLDRTRFASSFLCVSDDGPLRNTIAHDIPFRALGSHRGVLRALPGLYMTIRAAQPDIVVSTMAHMNFAVLMLQPFFPRTRFIVRESITPSFILNKRKAAAPLIRAAYHKLYGRADLVISPAQIIIDECRDMLGLDTQNHVLLPNPVDTDTIRGIGLATVWDAPGNTVRFAASGRLHWQKGFDRLIEALPNLPQAMRWHLTILGEGEEHSKLETLIKAKALEDRVSLPGLVTRPWPYYGAADAFLLPSRQEGLPNVALEALACGTPVIAMREAGGIGEIAALAPDAVRLCSTMDGFIAAMSAITTKGKKTYNPSLLPNTYSKKQVGEAFAGMLSDALKR